MSDNRKVFISYAREDMEQALQLYHDLKDAGMIPWMDEEDLLPGQNWQMVIRREIRESRYFVAVLSAESLGKRGYVQKELKSALDILGEFPDDEVFLIPVRLDECKPEDDRLRNLHWADMFPSYQRGLTKVLRAMGVKAGSSANPNHRQTDHASEIEIPKKMVNTLGMEFVYIPPGTFMMGSPPDEPGRFDNEVLHQGTLTKGFYMQTTQVTQKQWQAVMGNNSSYFKNGGDDCPVEQVSWDDAQEFIGKLNRKENIDKYRLPTEAEWEYACRAGTQTAIYTGDIKIIGVNNAPALDPISWYGGNSGVDYEGGYDSSGWKEKQYDHKRAGTHPVGKKQPNAFGLYDMIGNVWEWCQDRYGDYPSDAVTDPIGAERGSDRVLRGGGWYSYAQDCRTAVRIRITPDYRNVNIGFRLVRSLEVSSPA